MNVVVIGAQWGDEGKGKVIDRLASEDLGVRLAVSLTAVDDEKRARLMPIARKYPVSDLLAASEDEERKARVDRFLQEQGSFPILEEEGRVHFVYRGDVADIALQGSMLEPEEDRVLHRVPGTDSGEKHCPRGAWLDPAHHHRSSCLRRCVQECGNPC